MHFVTSNQEGLEQAMPGKSESETKGLVHKDESSRTEPFKVE
jgi:hypothetical protein